MDSLTQIVLGAAAGEVVLGKKIGNRAMVWGAIGGTIPDLDVLGSLFLSNIDNLAFHRGISHSLFFSVFGAFFFGWLVHQIYKSPHHKWIAIFFKVTAAIIVGFALDFLLARFFPKNYIPIILVSLALIALVYFNCKRRYFSSNWEAPKASVKEWQWLFFWSLVTHPILDSFTMYGTQLFAPFSYTRVAWNTISVADPLYTIPFLICLIVASRYSKELKQRRVWNYLGIAISSSYLLFTVINKQRVNRVFAQAMEKQNIQAERFITNPFILNNIVWNCMIETKDHYYQGQYSLFDEVDVEFNQVEKNHDLLKNIDDDPTIKTLRWFSKDYFNVIPIGEKYQFNDLRFGTFTGTGKEAKDYIFKFLLTDQGEKGYYMEKVTGGPPDGSQKEIFSLLWQRIKGKKKPE